MDDRIILHERLLELFPEIPIYFIPPSRFILTYPCIIYDEYEINGSFSNNAPYVLGTSFQITLMSNIPGFPNKKRILSIPNTTHLRSYTSDDIVHNIFITRVNTLVT